MSSQVTICWLALKLPKVAIPKGGTPVGSFQLFKSETPQLRKGVAQRKLETEVSACKNLMVFPAFFTNSDSYGLLADPGLGGPAGFGGF